MFDPSFISIAFWLLLTCVMAVVYTFGSRLLCCASIENSTVKIIAGIALLCGSWLGCVISATIAIVLAAKMIVNTGLF